MKLETGDVLTLESNNEYMIIGTYDIDEKSYCIAQNENDIGKIILFENRDDQIRIIKDKNEIDNILNKI